MKRLLSITALIAFFLPLIKAQDCQTYFPNTVNTTLEYKNYDKKNDLTGSMTEKVSDIKKSGNSVEATMDAEYFDAKGKSAGTAELKARCVGGVFYVDMRNYMNQQSMSSYKDMQMSMEGGNLEMPSNLKAGEVLKDGEMTMSFLSNGTPIMKMTISITNRKVEAVENVTTPAGTFECYKISYDINTKMMMNIKAKGVEWYAKDIGLVKSESYSSDGKLMGSTVLSGIKK